MSGNSAQLMIGEEATWGVPVTPTVGVPWVSGGMEHENPQIKSQGMVAGRLTSPTGLRGPGNIAVAGTYGFELYDRSIGTLMKHAIGTPVTSGPVSTLYTHAYAPLSLDGFGLTFQEGISDLTTTQPFTASGVKIAKWSIKASQGELATFDIDVLGRSLVDYRTVADGVTNSTATVTSATAAFGNDDRFKPISGTGIPANTYIGIINSATSIGLSSSNTTNTPVSATATATGVTVTIGKVLAAASYTAGLAPMSSMSGSVLIGGTAVCVRSIELNGENMTGERRCVGSALIDEPLGNGGYRAYNGSVDMEFKDMTQYRRFVNGTSFSLDFNLFAGTSTFRALLSAAYWMGSKPIVSPGNFPYVVTLPFESEGSTDANTLTLTLVNTDATP